METETGSQRSPPFLSLPCSSKERIERYFFEILIVQVGRSAEKGVRSRFWLWLREKDSNGHAEELGQFLQVGNGRSVGRSLPARDRVGRSLHGLGQLRLADALTSEGSPQLPNLPSYLFVDVRHTFI